MDYKEEYEKLSEEFNEVQDRIIKLEDEKQELYMEVNNLLAYKLYLEPFTTGWSVRRDSKSEIIFLSKDRGWTKELIGDLMLLLQAK